MMPENRIPEAGPSNGRDNENDRINVGQGYNETNNQQIDN